jgi:hypothetical protein
MIARIFGIQVVDVLVLTAAIFEFGDLLIIGEKKISHPDANKDSKEICQVVVHHDQHQEIAHCKLKRIQHGTETFSKHSIRHPGSVQGVKIRSNMTSLSHETKKK